MSAALRFGQGGAQFLYPRVHIRGKHGFLIVLFHVVFMAAEFTRRPRGSRARLIAVNALKVNTNFVVFRRPRVCRSVAAFATAVFAAQFHDGLISGRR